MLHLHICWEKDSQWRDSDIGIPMCSDLHRRGSVDPRRGWLVTHSYGHFYVYGVAMSFVVRMAPDMGTHLDTRARA